ncbi:uncharacterized protein LOC143020230 [Oratosquilla oratoria]|uniref:uncharacterized protein LOC143020230 n=1 Tax=Oratosquilla oratoria TaxID=337810 RepID=UPI003F774B77
MSQIPSHREVHLYQQNLRPELDDLEKRYSTSSSTDPEHRVLQSNPMDDCNVTIQHLLGWIAAYQEEIKLMDRQGTVNKRSNSTSPLGRCTKFKSVQRGFTLCRKDEQLQTAATEDRESQLPSADGKSRQM